MLKHRFVKRGTLAYMDAIEAGWRPVYDNHNGWVCLELVTLRGWIS